MNQYAWPNRTTPLQSAWSMALNAMTIECEWGFIDLFINNLSTFISFVKVHFV